MKEKNASGSRLATETVEGTALALEGVDDIQRGDRLPLGVLSVGNSITDDAFEEGLEHTTRFLVDHWKERNVSIGIITRWCVPTGE